MVKGIGEGYGGSDDDVVSGRNKGHAQNGEIKSARERCKERANQRLTTFGPTTSLFLFLAQCSRKAFVDRHHKGNEKMFGISKVVMVFQIRMGLMPRKLRFRWMGLYWIIDEFNGTYQLGIVAEEEMKKHKHMIALETLEG